MESGSYLRVGAPLDKGPDSAAHSLSDLLVEVDISEDAVVVVAVDLLDVAAHTHTRTKPSVSF